MSNEELIINSENGQELYNKLYIRNLRLIHKLCNSFYSRCETLAKKRGLEYEDMLQECFFAIPEAVQAYRKKGGTMKFTTFLHYPIIKCLSSLFSLRTASGRKEPLNIACSLDEPLPYDEEITLIETVPDANINIENDVINHEFLKAVFPTAQSDLNDIQYDIIRRYYKNGETFAQIAQAHNISVIEARQHKAKALTALRKDRRFVKYFTDVAYSSIKKSGLSFFRNNGMSCVEWSVLDIEKRQPFINGQADAEP